MAGIVIFVFIIGGLIAYICYANKHPYKPQPLQYVSTRDRSDDKFYCKIHNYYYGQIGVDCPSCSREYYNDIHAGIYPPGIDKSNKQFYFVEDWIKLREIDLRWKRGEITEQAAIEQKETYIKDTIPKRIDG